MCNGDIISFVVSSLVVSVLIVMCSLAVPKRLAIILSFLVILIAIPVMVLPTLFWTDRHIDYYMLAEECLVYEDVCSVEHLEKIPLIETRIVQGEAITRVVLQPRECWDYKTVDRQMKDLGYFPEIDDLLRENPETFMYCNRYISERDANLLEKMIGDSFFVETK